MNEYTTALLQIVSTELNEQELCDGIGMSNHASQQPPAPNAYYCFETSSVCDSEDLNTHIQKLEPILNPIKGFIVERISRGDNVTLLWFPKEGSNNFTILSPESMTFLGKFGISFLIQSKNQ
jgi:hypothetical protein